MIVSPRAVAAFAIPIALIMAGCTDARTPTSSTAASSTPSASASAVPTPSMPKTTAPTTGHGPGGTGVSDGREYSVAVHTLAGTTADGPGRWNVVFGVLTGGDPAVAAAFNYASKTAAREQLDAATSAEIGSTQWSFDSKGQVTFRSVAIAQAITGNLAYGAHPTQYTGTIVIDSRTAKPITLADLFTDEPTGLRRLSQQTKIPPVERNFLNWLPVADGMEIHLDNDQIGPSLPAIITVPWSEVFDLLAPNMAGLTRA